MLTSSILDISPSPWTRKGFATGSAASCASTTMTVAQTLQMRSIVHPYLNYLTKWKLWKTRWPDTFQATTAVYTLCPQQIHAISAGIFFLTRPGITYYRCVEEAVFHRLLAVKQALIKNEEGREMLREFTVKQLINRIVSESHFGNSDKPESQLQKA